MISLKPSIRTTDLNSGWSVVIPGHSEVRTDYTLIQGQRCKKKKSYNFTKAKEKKRTTIISQCKCITHQAENSTFNYLTV
jgi:hypothetical protein